MKKIFLALLVFMTASMSLFAQADLQVLAVVKLNKSESITVKQVKSRVATYEAQYGKAFTPEERKLVLDAMIEEKLILQSAAKEGLSIPDSTIDQYFLQSMSQQIGQMVTEKELNELVQKAYGKSLDDLLKAQVAMNTAEYKNFLKNSLIVQQYVVKAKQEELQKVAPTDADIRAFYENNKTSFVWNDMMKLFMARVEKGNDPDAAKLKCNDLRNKIVEKKLTMDQVEVQANLPDSGYQAGNLLVQKTEPFALNLGMTYPSLLTLFSQKEGFVSDLQETEIDYRVFVVSKKYDAKILAISDVVQPETTVTVYDYIRNNLTQQMQMQAVQIAGKELAVSLNTPETVEMKKTGDALLKLLDWGK